MPFFAIFGFSMLYYFVGISFIAGLAGLVFLSFLSGILTKVSAKVNE